MSSINQAGTAVWSVRWKPVAPTPYLIRITLEHRDFAIMLLGVRACPARDCQAPSTWSQAFITGTSAASRILVSRVATVRLRRSA